jgi:hypothetical protein
MRESPSWITNSLTPVNMKTFTAATALLAFSMSALAYQIQSYTAKNCGDAVLMDETRTIGDGLRGVKLGGMAEWLPKSLNIKLGDGENNGAT